jgi:uncharacterized protein (TIGR03435 family)
MTGSFVVSLLTAVTVVMAAALGVVHVSRRRRAATRHALLVAAFTIALVLPAASALAPYLTIRVSVPAPRVVANAVAVFDDVPPMPLDVATPVVTRTPAAPRTAGVSLAAVIETIWLLGFIGCLAPVAIGLFQVRSLRGLGLPWQRGRALAEALAGSLHLRRPVGIVLHESVSGPMTFGTWRPTIVMPIDAETWTDEALTRAIVHELEHIRRADWLTQCAARTLCAAYWFHPLVWIARRQLVLEAERASDDAVLRYAEAAAYADQLVDLARRLSAGHQPLLAMANRRDLAARVHALLDGQQSRGRAGAWLIAALACAAAALVMVLSPIRVVARAPRLQAADEHARFDVVSVRPCDPKAPPPLPPPGTGRGASSGRVSPGHFRINCAPVTVLIQTAYLASGRPSTRPFFDRWHAGPDWARSALFTIEATADEAIPVTVMNGPMLRAVLEDRFKLKVHRETREVPVLDLVVAKGGSKLTPFVPGTCVPTDYSTYPEPPLKPGQHRCLTRSERGTSHTWREVVEAATLDDWLRHFDDFANLTGRPPMVNKTGIMGLQTFQIEYSGLDDLPVDLKDQLGLELRPGRAPREFLILDHVERPVLDDADAPASAAPSAQATSSNAIPPLPTTFDVASIRPCEKGSAGRGGNSGSRGRGSGSSYSPGRLYLDCVPIRVLIDFAYVMYGGADGTATHDFDNWPSLNDDGARRIRGGPAWMYDEPYTLEARADGITRPDERRIVLGPMLRALLEQRSNLRIHKETEQAPMYALSVAKGGLKIKPMKDGECSTAPSHVPMAPLAAAADHVLPTCGVSSGGPDGASWRNQHGGVSIDRVAMTLSSDLGAKVIDRTGVTDRFIFTWVYGPDDRTPRTRQRLDAAMTDKLTPPAAPDIFTALEEQVGLHLAPIEGPRPYLVVDHIDRPTNDESRPGPAGARDGR